jgi:hypothetical protein
MAHRRLILTASVVGVAALVAACSSSKSSSSSATSTTQGAAGATATTASAAPTPGQYTTNLKGICPATVVVQTNWWPEPDHGFLYQLIGPNGNADTSKNSYSGPLGQTGVNLQIRAGGPAVGFQTVTSQMYTDDNIELGMVGTDEAIQLSASHPTTQVLAWYEKNPQIFFWGNPSWNYQSVADIGKANVTVLAFSSATYLDVWEDEGLLKKSQVDTSYTGDPSRFVAANGNIVSQGFATAEPYEYEHEVKAWMKPVKYLLVNRDYPVYQDAMAVRSDKLQAETPCLQKLIPLMQQAAIDYVHNPASTNQVIYSFAQKLKGGIQNTLDGSQAAVQTMLSQGIVANGTDGVFGSFDSTRVQNFITTLAPIFAAKNAPIKSGLQPSDIATNQFLNSGIHL